MLNQYALVVPTMKILHPEAQARLMKAGADPLLKNTEGQNAYELFNQAEKQGLKAKEMSVPDDPSTIDVQVPHLDL